MSLLNHISDGGMRLQADTTSASDVEAKIYETAYSSPILPNQLGLFAEALVVPRFEAFSAQSQQVSLKLVERLQNWPLDYTIEIDLSGSEAPKEALINLGPLSLAEWIDLSRTDVDEEALRLIIESAPNLEKLQLNNTRIEWNKTLVDYLLTVPKLRNVEIDGDSIDPAEYRRLEEGLKKGADGA